MSAFVDAGKLPPVAERLPKEPLVYKTANMPDGPGVYGDVMRHVIGGRPEGWNFWAGQSYGWGGIDIGLVECLTRTGPLFTLKAEDLQPMPNLAKAWEWSEDGKTLTVHLIEGAKWSDGDPFDTEDIDFYWNDIVMDPEVTPLMGASQETYGAGTTLEIIDAYTFNYAYVGSRVRPVEPSEQALQARVGCDKVQAVGRGEQHALAHQRTVIIVVLVHAGRPPDHGASTMPAGRASKTAPEKPKKTGSDMRRSGRNRALIGAARCRRPMFWPFRLKPKVPETAWP